MNLTVKEATIKAFHYPNLEALKTHILAFVAAYNFAAMANTLPGTSVCMDQKPLKVRS